MGIDVKSIMEMLTLNVPLEALLFSPSMALDVTESGPAEARILRTEKLGMRYVRMRVRQRVTKDGGNSIQAVPKVRNPVLSKCHACC